MVAITEDKLLAYVTAIEALEGEKATRNDEIKSLLAEAKVDGFIPSALKTIIKMRATPKEELEKQENAVEIYRRIVKV